MVVDAPVRPETTSGGGDGNGKGAGMNGVHHDHDDKTKNRKQRASHLVWVKLGDLVTAEQAQREYRPAWANKIAANLELEGIGYPVVSHRGGTYYIIDGQHRIAALKIFGFGGHEIIQCECYEGLNEAEEAELFLERNQVKTVAALDRFRVAINAGRKVESEIDFTVRNQNLRIGRGSITAVAALLNVFRDVGSPGLGKTLRIIRDSYGDRGFEGAVIEGIGLCVHRYGDLLIEETMVHALGTMTGGLNGLLTPAEKMRCSIGQPKPQCIAATAVGIYNRSHPAPKKKLASWWKE